MRKDAGLRIRVTKELREEFLLVCKNEDKFASDVIREFMESYVDFDRKRSQPDLFKINKQ